MRVPRLQARRLFVVSLVCLLVVAPALLAQERRVTAAEIVRLIEQGRFQQAETLLRQQRGSGPPFAKYLLGHVLLQQFRFDEAEDSLRLAVAERPENIRWRRDLARALRGQGRCLEAIAELDACIALEASPELRYDKAMCALDTGNRDLAASELEQALAGGWERARAWLELGKIRAAEGDDEAAREALLKALQLDSALLEATYQLGLLAAREGEEGEAVGHFRQVLEVVPGHVGAAYNLGRSLMRLGDVEAGQRALETFRALSEVEELVENHRMYLRHYPGDVKTRVDLGRLLLRAGRGSEATTVLQEALRLDPGNQDAAHWLAVADRLDGREAEVSGPGVGADGEDR